MRVMWPRQVGEYRGLYVLDPDVGHKLKPRLRADYRTGEYATPVDGNALGFRDIEHPVERPPGTVRVLVLGDSMTEALQVVWPDLYTQRLRGLLQARLDEVDVEIIRLAVGGYGFVHHYAAWRAYGRRYQPDLVLIAACPNDIEMVDSLDVPPTDTQLREAVRRHAQAMYTTPWWRFYQRSRLYFLMRNGLRGSASGMRLFDALRRRLYQTMGEDTDPRHEQDLWTALIARGQLSPAQEQVWSWWVRLMAALAAEIGDSGGRAGIVMIPFQEHVDSKQLQLVVDGVTPAVDWDRADARLRRELEAVGVAVISWAPAFRQALMAGEHLYFAHDRHLTARGHTIGAEVLAPWCAGLLAGVTPRRGS